MTTFQGVASSGKVAYFTAIFPYIGEYHFVYNLFNLFFIKGYGGSLTAF
jgi:hypothetical protein